MNHSEHSGGHGGGHHDHHQHGHHQHGAAAEDELSVEATATQQLLNVAKDVITTTLAPIVESVLGGGHGHHHDDHAGHGDEAQMDDVVNATAAATGHSGHGDHGAAGHWMKMWFHGDYSTDVILFDFWRMNSQSALIWSCVGIFILAALYEGIKWFRVHLQTVFEARRLSALRRVDRSTGNGAALLSGGENGRPLRSSGDVYAPTTSQLHPDVRLSCRQTLLSGHHLIQTALYILQLAVAYLLMLIVMTYNTYLGLAVVLGAGFGHWLFASFSCLTPPLESFASDACH